MKTEANNRFSIYRRIQSFRYAFEGIGMFFKTEHNAIIHFAATIAVIGLGFIFKVTKMEAITLVFAVIFVWVAELVNTAIEKIADMISVEKHPRIKLIKDISAAGVLVATLGALIVGCMIFLPKIAAL